MQHSCPLGTFFCVWHTDLAHLSQLDQVGAANEHGVRSLCVTLAVVLHITVL
jgi:hypothetical protein